MDMVSRDGVVTVISPRARRMSLRVDMAQSCVVLVRPKRASDSLVASFLADKRGWIERQLAQLPPRTLFTDGVRISILGAEYSVVAHPGAQRGVWRENETIFISGKAEHFARRFKDWLKEEARNAFAAWARDFAGQLNVKVTHISVRDTKARWGSCTRAGRLSLSWRLMFAPREVAAYVVAHEVAHLKHMNHSKAFWAVVESLAGDIKTPRAWLRRHGARLHSYI